MSGYNVAKFFNYSLDNWDYATVQPAKVPNRKGMLTHPAWLIAHAQNTETDPVIRGKWVREKLLAGTIPDVPITVDAAVPEDHHKTLRNRLASVTETELLLEMPSAHEPAGLRVRSVRRLWPFPHEKSPSNTRTISSRKARNKRAIILWILRDIYKTLPVNSTGSLDGTGDDSLDGDVRDAMDLAERLAKSRRVRQSIIRHAFRYFMGRNETLSDSKTLIDAEQAYVGQRRQF